jgi:hypothetical protein
MALLVSDTRQEDFSAPPPKKKWLQEYIEQDSSNSPSPTPSITNSLSTEAREFVRLFDNGTDQMLNKNLKELSENKHNKGKMTLSQEVIGGVVQGVLDQFQSFFELNTPTQVFKTELPEEEESEKMTESLGSRLSLKPIEKIVLERPLAITPLAITPVVQSVISQFLNGSLEDFTGSRKRSHKHLNCRHKGDGASARSRSVIRYKSRERQEAHREEQERVQEQAVHLVQTCQPVLSPPLPPLPEQDENEALNLSLPKPVQKVTFASRDRCYTTDHPSVKSFQQSKSEVISNLELALPPSVSPPCLSLPVIRHTSARSSPISFSPPSTPHLSYPPLATSPPPLEIIKKPEQLPTRSAISSTSFPVIKPLPLVVAPISEPGVYHSPPKFTVSYPQQPPPQELPPVPRQAAPTLPSRSVRERQENLSKEEIKRTSSSTREVHNRLEKNRRAHLKMCFDELAIECNLDPKKTSNLTVIRSAYKYTMTLKRKERENERSMASLVKQKIALQQRLEDMKRECPNFKPELDPE